MWLRIPLEVTDYQGKVLSTRKRVSSNNVDSANKRLENASEALLLILLKGAVIMLRVLMGGNRMDL